MVMSNNSFGRLFSFTTFGESHGEALGVVIDGFPSNVKIDYSLISEFLARRRPGQSKATTQRQEKDEYKILSGVFNDHSTGAPICVVVFNTDQRSKDYSNLEHSFRPGHADYTYWAKYVNRDYRGGGRSSGRETLARVIAGAFAMMVLKKYNISINSCVSSIGEIEATDYEFKPPFAPPLFAPECKQKTLMEAKVEEVRKAGDSIGSTVRCVISGLPVGLGEPTFDKLDAILAHAAFSLGAVKGFSLGSGFNSSKKRGSENNDEIFIKNGKPYFKTNNCGGILGGISNGADVDFTVFFKPTPSISLSQHTINDRMEEEELIVTGRHDPVIGPRATVVVEAMSASVILDSLLIWKSYQHE